MEWRKQGYDISPKMKHKGPGDIYYSLCQTNRMDKILRMLRKYDNKAAKKEKLPLSKSAIGIIIKGKII